MQKIVINRCFGGYGLSGAAFELIAKKLGKECHWFALEWTEGNRRLVPVSGFSAKDTRLKQAFDRSDFSEVYLPTLRPEDRNSLWKAHSIPDFRDQRDNPILVAVVEELGDNACSSHAELRVVEIPDGVKWVIEEDDGREWVSEAHQIWA